MVQAGAAPAVMGNHEFNALAYHTVDPESPGEHLRRHSYRTYALQSDKVNCDRELERSVVERAAPYPPDAKPIFVGHYWLTAPRPEILADNVACLDYSVAKGGFCAPTAGMARRN